LDDDAAQLQLDDSGDDDRAKQHVDTGTQPRLRDLPRLWT
jgi:hypothetical protein